MSLIEIVQILMTILLARYALDLNPELHSKVSNFDNSFKNIIDSYRKNNTTELFQVTKSFFGYLSLLLFLLLTISMYLFGEAKSIFFFYLAMAFIYAMAVWLAITWFSDKGKYALDMFLQFSKMSLCCLALPLLDLAANQELSLTKMMLQILLLPFEPLIAGLTVDLASSIWLDGLTIFLIIEGIFIIYLLLTTVLLAPIAISAFAFLYSTIKIANWATYLSRNRPLSPICFAILVITTVIEKLL
ncbi:hypothetical protein JKP10_21950 [Vibrio vulnificus]|uniref:hypothetical protein n=1 Tax=Vibrio vulnificus TaxID=672 RepID=UPI001CDB8F2F|nr:hypothetical protein [Vibrio vulnificus]EJR3610052.1 hypothetical protein [Vibrio vulnificus]ELV8795514.1 hypothetical protein [Vibrio vulnificus]MCA4002148.1 hypothetical protein [Vibrio vulnificus]MCA4011038.1 hypothetical protein [Vibrio vulnificus]MCU8417680.1 hypothetical protein [Vibrio vulnificus]